MLHSLGKVEYFFNAFYNYSEILDNLPPNTSSASKPIVEEVDLTDNHPNAETKEKNDNECGKINEKSKRKTATKITTSSLNRKSRAKHEILKKKEVELAATTNVTKPPRQKRRKSKQ